MSASISRGHFDGRAPAFRITLHAQQPRAIQSMLFAAPVFELAPADPCAHPEVGWQTDIFGDLEHVCTFCGREVPEVSNASR
jgi:hypothetical protein